MLEFIPVPVLNELTENVVAGNLLTCQSIRYLLCFVVQAEDEPWGVAAMKEELKEETATAECGLGTKRSGDLHYLG